jgi:hypothetical protein
VIVVRYVIDFVCQVKLVMETSWSELREVAMFGQSRKSVVKSHVFACSFS